MKNNSQIEHFQIHFFVSTSSLTIQKTLRKIRLVEKVALWKTPALGPVSFILTSLFERFLSIMSDIKSSNFTIQVECFRKIYENIYKPDLEK